MRLEVFKPESAYVRFRLENCAFARENDPEERTMYWIRGFFKGFFSEIFGVEVECKETTCMSRGDKYCTLELSRSSDTQTSKVSS